MHGLSSHTAKCLHLKKYFALVFGYEMCCMSMKSCFCFQQFLHRGMFFRLDIDPMRFRRLYINFLMNDFLGNSENYNATHFFPPSFKHLFYIE